MRGIHWTGIVSSTGTKNCLSRVQIVVDNPYEYYRQSIRPAFAQTCAISSRTSMRTNPRRFCPRHWLGSVTRSFFAPKPIPQIVSRGLASTSTASPAPSKYRRNAGFWQTANSVFCSGWGVCLSGDWMGGGGPVPREKIHQPVGVFVVFSGRIRSFIDLLSPGLAV